METGVPRSGGVKAGRGGTCWAVKEWKSLAMWFLFLFVHQITVPGTLPTTAPLCCVLLALQMPPLPLQLRSTCDLKWRAEKQISTLFLFQSQLDDNLWGTSGRSRCPGMKDESTSWEEITFKRHEEWLCRPFVAILSEKKHLCERLVESRSWGGGKRKTQSWSSTTCWPRSRRQQEVCVLFRKY